jgi:hypothetical protein
MSGSDVEVALKEIYQSPAETIVTAKKVSGG